MLVTLESSPCLCVDLRESVKTQHCVLVILLAVFEDASELDVVKVAGLDRRFSVHLVHLDTKSSK